MGKFLDWLTELFASNRCPLCGHTMQDANGCFCGDCLRRLIAENRRVCAECHEPAALCKCCPDRFEIFTEVGGRHWLSHCFYTGYEEDNPDLTTCLVYTAKQKNDRRLYRYIIGFLAADIRTRFAISGENLNEWVCTYPPRSAGGYRKYGFDQGEELARLLAKELGIVFFPMFVKYAGSEQKKAPNTAARQKNMEKSLFLKPGISPAGEKILLFDDIITTGSTMLRAANLLYEKGAACVFPVSYAKTKRNVK